MISAFIHFECEYHPQFIFSIKKGVDAEAHDENSNTALHGCMHFWESPFNLRLAALICSCMLGVTLPFVQ